MRNSAGRRPSGRRAQRSSWLGPIRRTSATRCRPATDSKGSSFLPRRAREGTGRPRPGFGTFYLAVDASLAVDARWTTLRASSNASTGTRAGRSSRTRRSRRPAGRRSTCSSAQGELSDIRGLPRSGNGRRRARRRDIPRHLGVREEASRQLAPHPGGRLAGHPPGEADACGGERAWYGGARVEARGRGGASAREDDRRGGGEDKIESEHRAVVVR